MQSRETVIQKIKNLLQLAENEGSTAGEAAAAMGRAQHLMDMHRIDIAMAEDFEAETTEEIRDWDDPMDTMNGRSLPTWLGRLAMVVARANGCYVYQSWTDGKKSLNIVGGASDATTARYFYRWIRRQVDEMAADYSGNGRTWINNWRLGCVEEIGRRLKDARESAKQEAVSDGHALVVVENAVVKLEQRSNEVQAWAQKKLRLGGGRRASSRYDGGARAQGRRDGARVNITSGSSAQLGGGPRRLS